MNRKLRIVAVVCIAVFAFTAITAMPAMALVDALTPVENLFNVVCACAAVSARDVALPTAPVVDVQSPRPPPLSPDL